MSAISVTVPASEWVVPTTTRTSHQLFHLVELFEGPGFGIEQMVAIARVAAHFVAHAHKIDAGLHQFATNLIDGAIGEGAEQHLRVGVGEFLEEQAHQALGGLPGARRAHQQKEVAGGFGLAYQLGEFGIFGSGEQLHVCCGGGRSLSEHPCAAIGGGGEQVVEAAVNAARACVHEIRFDGPRLSFAETENPRFGLRLAKGEHHLVFQNLAHGGAKHHVAPQVRFAGRFVAIEHHDVAR